MSRFKPYWDIMVMAARGEGANPGRLMASVIQTLARIGLVAAIYAAAYKVAGSRSGLSFANTVWTSSLCFALYINLGIRTMARTIDAEVRQGAIETALTRPLDWRLIKFCEHLGRNGLEFLVQIGILLVLLLVTVGPPQMGYVTPGVALAFMVFFVFSVASAAAIFTTVGLSSFWLGDANSVYRIVDKLALVCCGTFVPIALLPHGLQLFVRYSPFGPYASPAQIFNPGVVPVLVPTLISAVIWTVVMILLCQLIWQLTMKRVEVNGG